MFSRIVFTLGARVLSAALGIFSAIIVARLLGVEGQGRYSVFLATVFLGAQFLNFGVQSANTFFVGSNKKLRHRLLSNSLLVAFFSSIIWIIFIEAFPLITGHSAFDNNFLKYISYFFLPIELLFGYFQALALGMASFRLYNSIDILRKMLFLGALVALISLDVLTLFNALVALCISSLLGVLAIGISLFERRIERPSLPVFKVTFKYGVWIYVATLMSFLILRSDLIMLNYFVGVRESGYYSIAVSLGDALYLIPTSVAAVLFSKYSNESEIMGKWISLKKTTVVLLLGLIPLCIGVFFFSRTLISTLYGEEYLNAAGALEVLIPGILFLSIATQMQSFLAGINAPFLNAFGAFLVFLLNLVLNFFFIPKYGAVGAALASTLSYAIWAVLSFYLCLRKVGQNDSRAI